MLDLDVIENLTIDFKLKGRIINMRIPSQKLLRSIEVLGTTKKSTTKQEEQMYKLFASMLSNNLNDIEFTVEDLQELNIRTLKALMEHVMEVIQDTKKK